MKIGIIGPTKIDEFCKLIGMKKNKYIKAIINISRLLKNHEIILTTDKNSVAEIFAKEYKKAGGKKVVGIVPRDDKEFGYSWINLSVCDEIINCGTWRNQPEKLCEESNIILCLGFSPGSLIEIAYTKWFKVKKILILKELISKELPEEINKKLNIKYISIRDLKNELF